MEAWHIWVIVALLFVIVEIFTSDFSVICLSFGCLGGAIGAACDVEFKWQMLLFAAATFLAFVFVRPLLKRLLLRKGGDLRTNADALIGRVAVVSESIEPALQKGRVAVDGDDWKAISEDDEPIAKGERVVIVSRESVILTVKKL